MQKIHTIIESILLLLFICAGSGLGIQSKRISMYEQQLRQYRDAAERITEYQQSIDVRLQSAQECISSATCSVHELREGLRTLEKVFNDLENDNNNLRSCISNIDTNNY